MGSKTVAELVLIFPDEEARDVWEAYWLDGGGEQGMEKAEADDGRTLETQCWTPGDAPTEPRWMQFKWSSNEGDSLDS